MKIFTKVSALILALFLVPVAPMNTMAASNSSYLEVGFDDYVTNDKPGDFAVSSETYYISEYAELNKGLAIMTSKTPSTVDFAVTAGNKFAVSFDIKVMTGAVDGYLRLYGNGNEALDILKFNTYNEICAYNGYYLTGYNASVMTNIAIEYDGSSSSCTIYRNGKKLCDNFSIKSTALSGLTKLCFGFSSEADDNGVILDNISVTDWYDPKAKIVTSYNPDSVEKPDMKVEKKIGTEVLQVADFEYVCTLSNQHKQNKVDLYKEEDGNQAMRFQRATTADCHLDATEVISNSSDCVVYELDFKLYDLNSAFEINLKTENSLLVAASVAKTGIIKINGSAIQLEANKWYRFGIMVDYFDRVADYYFDRKKLSSAPLPDTYAVGNKAYTFRVHVGASYADMETDRFDFLVDNVRAYEAIEPIEDLSQVKREVVISEKSVFADDIRKYNNMLKGYICVHALTGVVFENGTKNVLPTLPYEKDGKVMINASELDAILGRNSGLNGDVSMESYASAIGLRLSVDTDSVSAGMMMMGNGKFEFPADPQSLNNYLMYHDPTPEKIREDYNNSPVKGVHPRIQFTKADFERIKTQAQTNTYVKKWVDKILTSADSSLDEAAVKYELRDGVRLQYVSREVLEKMYLYGMAYQLTGEQKYVTRAYKDMEAVCGIFPDWHPSHQIDTGMMAAAAAIGYDWLYEGYTEEQRKVIEEGIYKNCFYHANLSYQTEIGPLGVSARNGGNHNSILNGGFVMAACAMLDVYPDIADFIASNAIRGLGYMYHGFKDEGSWYEGASYWELTMQYTAKSFSTMDSVFGTCYGLDRVKGLTNTARFMIAMQTPDNGIYTFGDSVFTTLYVPELFWLANKYNEPGIASAVMKITEGNLANVEDYALALGWYDITSNPEAIELPTDFFYMEDGFGTMRNSWDNGATFVGYHAGKNNVGHAHLDAGSFIFESNGIRWGQDPTHSGYNQPGFFQEFEGGKRWSILGLRAEDHSVIEINPDGGQGQVYVSVSPIIRAESKPKGAIVVADTTAAYKKNASSVQRGFWFTDNRQSLVVRDEIQLYNESDVCWYFITEADIAVTENGAILTQNGRQMKLEYVTDAATSSVEIEGIKDGFVDVDNMNPELPIEVQRLVIKCHGSDNVNITVKLTPIGVDGASVNEYDMPISEWKLPDGEIPVAPKLSSVNIGGKTIAVEQNIIEYYYVDGSLNGVPDITVDAPECDIQIEKGNSNDMTSYITLTRKSDPAVKNKYIVLFIPVPKPVEFEGMTSHPIISIEASDEPQAANRAVNVLDGDFTTRWSASGIEQYIVAELDELNVIDKIGLGFTDGGARQTRITILVSENGSDYTQVYKGLSKGTSNEYEFYDVGGLKAKYVKIIGDGNTTSSVGGWTSITELVAVKQN
ncbi:MAG: heparinase II/III family protein [Clostridia bacterium]|nr:heparinase II/III family protein [Clostridia bacterium]